MDHPIAYVQQQPGGYASHMMQAEVAPQQALPEGFVYLDEALDGVLWDAKYAADDNFTGATVDGYEANRIVCSNEMIDALALARDAAGEQGYLLLVWDAARPQRAVDAFVRWSEAPEDGSTKQRHYPNIRKSQLFGQGYIAKKSGHSRGAAVDLTLVSIETGAELDMGGGFDLMDAKSHHGAPGLSADQQANRKALRGIMERCGFAAYANEWWHYSLKSEPFAGQYFDFVIGGRPADAHEDEPVGADPMKDR